MTTLLYHPLALAGFIPLASLACARSSAVSPADDSPLMGVDPGPFSRLPRTQPAMAGARFSKARDKGFAATVSARGKMRMTPTDILDVSGATGPRGH